MENLTKISLKIGSIEITVEGSSEFVSNQYDKIKNDIIDYFELSKKLEKVTDSKSNNREISDLTSKDNNDLEEVKNKEFPETFGEWLNLAPKDMSDTDKALLAGYFHQINTENNVFKVKDVTKTLKDHGIKLTNPSNLLKSATKGKKYIFQYSKDGKQINYRFSRDGEIYIQSLLLDSNQQ